VAQSHVVDQDADIQSVGQLLQAAVVRVLVQRKVHCECLGRDLGSILGRDVGGEGVELGLSSRYEDEIVAFGGERESKFLANAIRGTGDESPGAARSVAAELEVC